MQRTQWSIQESTPTETTFTESLTLWETIHICITVYIKRTQTCQRALHQPPTSRLGLSLPRSRSEARNVPERSLYEGCEVQTQRTTKMCILVTALHDCGHQRQELQRERCIFFYSTLILMKRHGDRYGEEIEMNKKDCVSTSKDKQELRTDLCPTCSVAAAKPYTHASKPAESGARRCWERLLFVWYAWT
jgi:hypothetical protein